MSIDLTVVVASRGRPELLSRCLAGLALQDHPRMEIVLVSDPGGLGVRPDIPARRIGFDRPNLPQARNLGIAAASGEIVAFIDDDAVPEPCWARALAGVFADQQVIAATGGTLGPDGVSWQARAEWLTADGPVSLADHTARLWFPQNGGTLSAIGTNCAFRRDALIAVGGFDPLFAYHLDESDLNLRMASAFPHRATAFVPQAQVQHGAAAGVSRSDGAPSDLTSIGRSGAIFARRHGASAGWQDRLRRVQRRRLLRAMLAGRLDALLVRPILASLEIGLSQGMQSPIAPPTAPLDVADNIKFAPIGTRRRDHITLAGWHWHARSLRARAAAAVGRGNLVSLMLWSPSFLPHREYFTSGGWWERRGGVWGAPDGSGPPVMLTRRSVRERQLMLYWKNTRQPLAGCLPQTGQ